jgi:hypothetical protein
MSKFIVSICRVEHHIYQLEIEADSSESAESLAMDVWENDDEKFTHCGIVHAEEFTENVKREGAQ